ncbi:MAG TPA: GAF domain-containing sensor histidine kinase [Candidatus Limnocylindria bacterium]|nr:GAF domain-containing sensor histidine kinase [Candidatus Limnocylindria bacterium]
MRPTPEDETRTPLPPAVVALDAAVRGISAVLDVEEVLQLIVDRVRDLVSARYAALGIVDQEGTIAQFITSGITGEQRAAIGDLPRGRGLLGLIIRENRSYRIPQIGAHPESFGFPPNHPPMTSFLGVPVTVKGEPVGRLYLTDKQGAREFSLDDQALVETFALHAGIAIENARLHEQVRRLAVVDERDRISRDLHDGIIQRIYGVTLALDDVPELVNEAPDEAARRVDEAIDQLHAVIRDIRTFIFGLRPLMLGDGGLREGLQALADELSRNAVTEIQVSGAEPSDLPLAVTAELLAIAREALANVARHAAADHAWLRLTTDGAMVQLEIDDDGAGFDAEAQVGRAHHGLANMRSRAEGLGGSLALTSTPGAGARIIVRVPRAAPRRGPARDV